MAMTVFPAVDILGGKCVQLVQGRRETATVFGDPVDCARRWVKAGAEALHVINLDGAFGAPDNGCQWTAPVSSLPARPFYNVWFQPVSGRIFRRLRSLFLSRSRPWMC